MKYHDVTYSGPRERTIGAMKLMATSSRPASARGSIQTGVSPHSRPWAPSENGRFASDATLACSVGPKHDAHARGQHDDLPGDEDEPRQAAVEHRLERQPRNGPVQRAQKGVGQKAVGDRVGVHHPPAARREAARCRSADSNAPVAAPSAARPASTGSDSPRRTGSTHTTIGSSTNCSWRGTSDWGVCTSIMDSPFARDRAYTAPADKRQASSSRRPGE